MGGQIFSDTKGGTTQQQREAFQKQMEQDFQRIAEELGEQELLMEDLYNEEGLLIDEADEEAKELHEEQQPQYKFAENNQYVNEENPLQMYQKFIDQGMVNEAILCLEAHLQKNMQDQEHWRIKGILH